MSNQVYSSGTEKYYALPGLNNYLLSGDQTVSNGVTANIAYHTASLVQGAGLVTPAVTGIFTVDTAGMYHVQAEIGLDSADHTKSDAFQARLVVTRAYDPLTDINVRRLRTRMPNEGVALLDYVFIYSVGFTGYLGVGDTIRTVLTNNAIANVLTIKSANSDFIVTKIY